MIAAACSFALGYVSANIAKHFSPPYTKKWWVVAIGLGIGGSIFARIVGAWLSS